MSINHYVYKVYNESGEYYYGKRSCRGDIRGDTYMGSGVLLRSKLRSDKHLWIKQVVEVCGSEEEAFERERELIGDLWKDAEKCLNLTQGGRGGTVERNKPPFKTLEVEGEAVWLYNHAMSLRLKAPKDLAAFLIASGWSPTFKWACNEVKFRAKKA